MTIGSTAMPEPTATTGSARLPFAAEVEWFDQQAGKALASLERAGELDDTTVVMTSDHGMRFPRVKGQIY
jgi:N-sulfoglucosamine sulfohydrolase